MIVKLSPLILVAAVLLVFLLQWAGVVGATAANICVMALIVLAVGIGVYRSRRAKRG
jgi:hypothetical protein